MIFVLMALGLLLAAFCLQGLLLHLARRGGRILAFAPLLCVMACWQSAWHYAHAHTIFHFQDLTAFAHGAAGALILLGWALGWAVWGRKG